MIVLVFIGSLLGLMALGMPVAFALIGCGLAMMFYMGITDPQIIIQNMWDGANSFPLLAVPFFMLAGEFMNAGGMTRRIITMAMAWVGHIRGGLGYVAVMAAVIMAMSSSNHGVSAALVRTTTSRGAKPPSCRVAATRARASPFALGATASSRSMTTTSAGRLRAFSSARGFEPGMNSTLRRGRTGVDMIRSAHWQDSTESLSRCVAGCQSDAGVRSRRRG